MKDFRGVVVAKRFTKPGKKIAVQLYCVAGELPEHNVIAQEIADSECFELNKRYEVLIQETEPNDVYGRQFTSRNLGEWNGSVLKAIEEYGSPKVYEVKQGDFTALKSE